ncbi:MAG: DUF4139 domain-containing protein [Terracidiphilus sp.]
MNLSRCFAAVFFAASVSAAQQPAGPEPPATALTIYNQDFAVARTTLNLDLHAGINSVETNQVTNQLEPDSVILRGLGPARDSAKPSFRILEQNYEAAVVTQDFLLQKYEGKTIEFEISPGTIVEGKIIRAPSMHQNQYGGFEQTPALIDVKGQMQFQLPGMPLFPASTDGLLLKPALRWQIESEKPQEVDAELAYITNGLNWEATYNVVAQSGGAASQGAEKANLVGWVTIKNDSGADFPMANIKLMAGDVARIQPRQFGGMVTVGAVSEMVAVDNAVTQKPFDDFHLYDLHRTVSLADGETKQIQFLDAAGIAVERSYIYDGSAGDPQNDYNNSGVNMDQNFHVGDASHKVEVVEEIGNTEANHLGIPLPAGRLRFYRRDADGQVEFVGESIINHIPAEGTVKVTTGSAFDIKGSRRQTDFAIDNSRRTMDEGFEIKLTNQKVEAVSVKVLEHLYRGNNWEVEQKSADFSRLDSHTIEFPVQVPAKGSTTLNYKVRYTW